MPIPQPAERRKSLVNFSKGSILPEIKTNFDLKDAKKDSGIETNSKASKDSLKPEEPPYSPKEFQDMLDNLKYTRASFVKLLTTTELYDDFKTHAPVRTHMIMTINCIRKNSSLIWIS